MKKYVILATLFIFTASVQFSRAKETDVITKTFTIHNKTDKKCTLSFYKEYGKYTYVDIDANDKKDCSFTIYWHTNSLSFINCDGIVLNDPRYRDCMNSGGSNCYEKYPQLCTTFAFESSGYNKFCDYIKKLRPGSTICIILKNNKVDVTQ